MPSYTTSNIAADASTTFAAYPEIATAKNDAGANDVPDDEQDDFIGAAWGNFIDQCVKQSNEVFTGRRSFGSGDVRVLTADTTLERDGFGTGNSGVRVGDFCFVKSSGLYRCTVAGASSSTWVDVASGAGVSSFEGRTGVVTATAGDYAASEVTNDSTAPGANVEEALDSHETRIFGLEEAVVPASGAAGQMLLKASTDDYSFGWGDDPVMTVPSLVSQASHPGTPPAGTARFYTRHILPIAHMRGEVGPPWAIQPALWNGSFTLITPNTTTSVSVQGNSVTSVGTLSHPTPTTTTGWMTNWAGAVSLNATAGTGNNTTPFVRGAATTNAAGFLFVWYGLLPDASYNNTGASTGARIFAGLTNQSMATMVGADDPAGHYCGFARRNVNGGATDTNWRFFTKDNVTLASSDTGVAFTATNRVRMMIFCPPGSSTIYWHIQDLTAGTEASGSTSSNLPGTTTYMRAGFQVGTVDAVARNIRSGVMYCQQAQG